jgi:hypothetical protein
LAVLGFAIFALDHGLYVGKKSYEGGSIIETYFRYLFITGVSEIHAYQGERVAPTPGYPGGSD